MSIKIGDIIKSLAEDINSAYDEIRKAQISVDIAEVETTLNLDVELNGRKESSYVFSEGSEARSQTSQRGRIVRYTLSDKNFKEKGISFRKIGTTHYRDRILSNLTIRVLFLPEEKLEG